MTLRAGIVGLGRVGMLFDDDAKRDRVWTHFSAYERLADRFDLVAVAEPDEERRQRALARRPPVAAFGTLDELLDASLDVVSLCTPPELHAEQLAACAGRVRAVVCEKPLAARLDEAAEALAACAAAGTLVAVNYYKRYETAVRAAAALLAAGEIGVVRTAVVLYAGPLDSVGSHAVDLLDFLVGPLEIEHVVDAAAGPGASLRFGDGAVAMFAATGPREDLVFEVDLHCNEGRLRLLDNCSRLEISRFERSDRYGGYRELGSPRVEEWSLSEPFLALFADVAAVLEGSAAELASDGASALRAQRVLEAFAREGMHA